MAQLHISKLKPKEVLNGWKNPQGCLVHPSHATDGGRFLGREADARELGGFLQNLDICRSSESTGDHHRHRDVRCTNSCRSVSQVVVVLTVHSRKPRNRRGDATRGDKHPPHPFKCKVFRIGLSRHLGDQPSRIRTHGGEVVPRRNNLVATRTVPESLVRHGALHRRRTPRGRSGDFSRRYLVHAPVLRWRCGAFNSAPHYVQPHPGFDSVSRVAVEAYRRSAS